MQYLFKEFINKAYLYLASKCSQTQPFYELSDNNYSGANQRGNNFNAQEFEQWRMQQ